jgi:transcription antitermination factor NusA-like protein
MFIYGHKWKWYCSRVSIKQVTPPRVEISLSRSSKEFVAGLLRDKVALVKEEVPVICATRRIPGQFTEIVTQSFIPHIALQAVANELGEKIIFRKERRK